MPCVAYTFQRHIASFAAFKAGFTSHQRSSKVRSPKPPSTSSGRDLISEKPSSIPEPHPRLQTPFFEDERGFSEVLTFIRGETGGGALEEEMVGAGSKGWHDPRYHVGEAV